MEVAPTAAVPADSFESFYRGQVDSLYRALAVTLGDFNVARAIYIDRARNRNPGDRITAFQQAGQELAECIDSIPACFLCFAKD